MARHEEECSRCDGKGKVQGFGHVANGVCFSCHGTGVELVSDRARAEPKARKLGADERATVEAERLEQVALIKQPGDWPNAAQRRFLERASATQIARASSRQLSRILCIAQRLFDVHELSEERFDVVREALELEQRQHEESLLGS